MKLAIGIAVLSILLIGCNSDIAEPRLHVYVYSSPNPDGFYLQVFKQYSNEKPLIIRINGNKIDSFRIEKDFAIEGFWSDSILIYTDVSDSGGVCSYNLYTHKHEELLPEYGISQSSNDCSRFVMYNRKTMDDGYSIFSFNGKVFQLLSTIKHRFDLTFINDSLLIGSTFSPREPDTVYVITPTGHESVLEVFEKRDHYQRPVYDLDTTLMLTGWSYEHPNNAVVAYATTSSRIDTIFAGYHFDQVMRIPKSGYYLLSGLTSEEHIAENNRIQAAVAKYRKDNPDVTCARPRPPQGYWMVGHIETGAIKKLPYSLGNPTISQSGKNILFVNKSDTNYTVNMISINDLISKY